jgi:hypothetical protein
LTNFVYDSTFVSSVDKLGESDQIDIIVFPNPSDGAYYIKAPEEILYTGPLEPRFYNSSGDLIHTEKTDDLYGTFKLNNQPAGVYFMQILRNHRIIDQERLILMK